MFDGAQCAEIARLCAVAEAETRSRVRPVDTKRWQKVARLPVLVWAFAGFAELWDTLVPESFVDATTLVPVVACPCGAKVRLEEQVTFCECEPETRRWYLLLEDGSVRVCRWEGPFPTDDEVAS